MWMTSCTGSARGRFGVFWKSQLSWVPGSEEDGWLSLARRSQASVPVSGAYVVWCRWKSQVYLSPYVEKPLYSKVIKSFVPELRSRKCFSCFGIPMFYVYMSWTFYVRFTYSCMGIVTRKIYFYPKTGLYFRTCEDGAGWHLIPCRISPRSEFLLRHIRTGILCRGSIYG